MKECNIFLRSNKETLYDVFIANLQNKSLIELEEIMTEILEFTVNIVLLILKHSCAAL